MRLTLWPAIVRSGKMTDLAHCKKVEGLEKGTETGLKMEQRRIRWWGLRSSCRNEQAFAIHDVIASKRRRKFCSCGTTGG